MSQLWKARNEQADLVIPHKSTGLRESGLLADFAPEILRCAQDDTMKKAVILSAAKDLLRAYG